MRIFVIGGKARCGKSTFGTYLREELKEYGYKPCVMHITEPLYTYAKKYFSWDGDDSTKPREFLQKMGIEIIKEKLGKKDFLLNRVYEDMEILSNFFDTFIITDARLKDEFSSIKNKFEDVVTIKLERDNYDNGLNDEEGSHITEVEIDEVNDFDYVIKNTSLEELKKSAEKIVEEIEGEII